MKKLHTLMISLCLSLPSLTMATTTINLASPTPGNIYTYNNASITLNNIGDTGEAGLGYFSSPGFQFQDTWNVNVGANELLDLSFTEDNSLKLFVIKGFDSIGNTFNGALTGLSFTGITSGFWKFTVQGTTTGILGGGYSVSGTLSAVPVPAAAWLLGTAMIGLASFRKRKPAFAV